MKKKYPEAYEYFSKRRSRLEKRTDYSAGPFYTIFRISKEKASAWRVAYAYTGTQLEAVVIPKKFKSALLESEKELIVEETAYFVTAKDQAEAFYIAGLLNSLPLRAYVQSFCKPKGFPYFGFYQWNVGILPIPRYDGSNEIHTRIAKLSREAHSRHEATPELDFEVAKLYALNSKELEALRITLEMLTGRLQTLS